MRDFLAKNSMETTRKCYNLMKVATLQNKNEDLIK